MVWWEAAAMQTEHVHVWEVPGLQVLGCQMIQAGGYRGPAGAGSEMLLLIADHGACPYQSFLFSSTLFCASSWLSEPCDRVSLISLICSYSFSVSFACESRCVGQGTAFVCGAEL